MTRRPSKLAHHQSEGLQEVEVRALQRELRMLRIAKSGQFFVVGWREIVLQPSSPRLLKDGLEQVVFESPRVPRRLFGLSQVTTAVA